MNRDDAIDALKALAHPLRFRILDAVRSGERNVGEIEQATGIGQPALSQQLAVLRSAGLVLTRKAAKLVYYRVDDKRMAQLRDRVGELAGSGASGATPSDLAGASTPARPAAPGVANFARMS